MGFGDEVGIDLWDEVDEGGDLVRSTRGQLGGWP